MKGPHWRLTQAGRHLVPQLLDAFANTARQTMTAELPTRSFLNRGRPSNSDVSKRLSAVPMITELVWMSASILYNTEVRAQTRANCGGK